MPSQAEAVAKAADRNAIEREEKVRSLEFRFWWLSSNLRQFARNDDAAYAITNFCDAMLSHAFDRDAEMTKPQAKLILDQIRAFEPLIAEFLPVDPVTAAEGMRAAARIVDARWVGRDWPQISGRERWAITAPIKILRNATHSVALRREFAERFRPRDPDFTAAFA